MWVADSESEASSSEVFNALSRRGLRGVRYVVSDDHQGMLRAIERHFKEWPGSAAKCTLCAIS